MRGNHIDFDPDQIGREFDRPTEQPVGISPMDHNALAFRITEFAHVEKLSPFEPL
jgi:hypothetical protein